MKDTITKKEYIKLIKDARQKLNHLIQKIPVSRMNEAGVAGKWSVKDILAHLAWHEWEMVAILESRTFRGSEWWQLDLDERNEKIYQKYKDLNLETVRSDYEQVHAKMMYLLETLPETDLHDPKAFPGMPEGWSLAEVMAGNTYEHYDDHREDLEAWAKKIER